MSSKPFVQIKQSVVILLILLVVNSIWGLTFTPYLFICAFALLMSSLSKKRIHYSVWCVVVISSVLITLNYLRPIENDGKTIYNNAAHNALVLRGLEINTDKSNFYIVNSAQPQSALYDSGDYYGHLSVKALDSIHVELSHSLMSHPIYYNNGDSYSLANKQYLSATKFYKSITFKDKDTFLSLKFENSDKGDLRIIAQDNKNCTDTAAFHTLIKEGYPISSIISSFAKDSLLLKDELSSLLHGVYVVRDNAPCKEPLSEENPLYLTGMFYKLSD